LHRLITVPCTRLQVLFAGSLISTISLYIIIILVGIFDEKSTIAAQ
jgi:hypothetical protein